MKKLIILIFNLLLPFSATAYFSAEDTGKELVTEWFYDEVPITKFLQYFQRRGYLFLKNASPCEYAQITYTQEANKYGGTVYFTQCHYGFFHSALIHIYRNLPQSDVDESIKDVRHLFMQVTRENMKTQDFIKDCLEAPDGYQKSHEEQYYSFKCAVSNYDYVFELSFNQEHPHPPIEVKQTNCLDEKTYERMIRTRLFERAKFARRLDEFYLLYPEEEPEEHKQERKEQIQIYNDVSRLKEHKKYYWRNDNSRWYRRRKKKSEE